jgi:hypothetical protein
MERFSRNWLAKNTATQVVIPGNYTRLGSSVVLRETEKAYLVKFDMKEKEVEKWIPKSNCIKNTHGLCFVPDWLYKKFFEEL